MTIDSPASQGSLDPLDQPGLGDDLGLTLSRNAGAPLHEQLRHHLQYLINTGILPPGQSLPSVRRLAERLDVAKATVQRAYTDLQAMGQIESRHGAGTSVVEFRGAADVQEIDDTLVSIADTAITAVRDAGMDPRLLRDAIDSRLHALRHLESHQRFVICYVDELDFMNVHVTHLSRELQGLPVDLRSADWRDYREDRNQARSEVDQADLVLCAPYVFGEVLRELPGRSEDIEGITFVLRSEVEARLAQIDPTQRVGIVATRPEYMSWTSAVVQARVVGLHPPIEAFLGDEDAMEDVGREADVIVYGSGSRGEVERRFATSTTVELRHVPDPGSVERLKALLARRMSAVAGQTDTVEHQS